MLCITESAPHYALKSSYSIALDSCCPWIVLKTLWMGKDGRKWKEKKMAGRKKNKISSTQKCGLQSSHWNSTGRGCHSRRIPSSLCILLPGPSFIHQHLCLCCVITGAYGMFWSCLSSDQPGHTHVKELRCHFLTELLHPLCLFSVIVLPGPL